MQQMQAPSRARNGCMQGMFLRLQIFAPRELVLAQTFFMITYELFK